MKRLKKLAVWMIVMFCMGWQGCISAGATGLTESASMDVVMVVDVSGSMKHTDPDKVALEGAKLFVDMMENTGSRAGMVAFSDQLVQVYNLTSINSDADKTNLKNTIDTLSFDGDTDIGSAMQTAVQMLTTAQDVGNSKMILFFTDGEIDLPAGSPSEEEAEALSRQNAEAAINEAGAAGIPIYTIGLNVNGGVDTDLISAMSSSTGANSSVVTSAGELPPIFNDIFADFVETEISELGDVTIPDANTYVELPFSIPNDSVLEANIVMITSGEGTLTDLQLIRPDTSTIAPDGQTVILSTSSNYNMLKLIGPMAGSWTLRIRGDQGCQVHVSLLFNYDVILRASGQADAEGNLVLTATLEKNGGAVSDAALYGQLTTTANVTRSDGTVTAYPMTLLGTSFSCTIPVEPGEEVTAAAHTEGANMYRDSDPITYRNETVAEPELTQLAALPTPIEISGLLPTMAKTSLDLDSYFALSDPSAGVIAYSVQLADDTVAGAEINGSELLLTGASRGSTVITVAAADNLGNALSQQAEVVVSATFGSILPLILIPVGILLLLLVIFVILKLTVKPKLTGHLFWQLLDEDGYTTQSDEEPYDLSFARKKAQMSNIVTEITLAYAGLNKIEITGLKNGILVQNKNKGKNASCALLDENDTETKKMKIFDGNSFKIACQTEDGDKVLVSVRYQRVLEEMIYE